MIVKVCGMREPNNIRRVESLPIQWMGFIFYPPSQRYVDSVPAYMPSRVKRVGVFVNASLEFIKERSRAYGLDMIQLHGQESPQTCDIVRNATRCSIIKAFGIKEDTDWNEILHYDGHADYLLFDTHCDTAGGSGKTFDHNLLEQYTGKTPFLLSGGIGLDNANEIERIRHPLMVGVDLNSKFEIAPAVKSTELLQEFIELLTTK